MTGYDKYIVTFSGGKDSMACFLHLLDIGIPVEKIELWHHDIDGHGETFMDWEITPDYCRKFAAAFGVPIYFSYKEGGFKREMLRNNEPTAATWFEVPEEEYKTSVLRDKPLSHKVADGRYFLKIGGNGDNGTRMKFPQVSADLSVRWCSAYLKIDVCSAAIRNQRRFDGLQILVLSGERGEESPARAKYNMYEPDKADLRDGRRLMRWVDRWRPIRDWTEKQVWDIIRRYKIRVHPAYYLGWGRVSCKFCIFGNANQFASANSISPVQGAALIDHEKQFGCTMKRNTDLQNLINSGTPYVNCKGELVGIATGTEYPYSIVMDEAEEWLLPAGAFGDGCGPV